MSTKKQKPQWVVKAGGVALGFGLKGLFGTRNKGYLIPSSDPAIFAGEASAKSAIRRTEAACKKIKSSVIHDWVITKPLFHGQEMRAMKVVQ